MSRLVALIKIDVSEELSASFIRVTRIGELGTTLAVTSNRRTLRRNRRVFVVCFRKDFIDRVSGAGTNVNCTERTWDELVELRVWKFGVRNCGVSRIDIYFITQPLKQDFLNLNLGQPRTLLQLKLVGILTINLFLT
jgi:hypothetical protein